MILQVGVKIFLKNDEGKFLLLKREEQKYADVPFKWDVPGGRIDPGTPLTQNLRRELEEEIKVTLKNDPTLIYAQDIIVPDEKHVVRLTFVGSVEDEPVLDHEHTEYKWLSLEEMKNFEHLDRFAREVVEKDLLK